MLMRNRPRRGYTIIELLVAMALIMTIMAILSEAFVVGLETFGKLKALGDMAERLRTASTIVRRDLDATHFEGGIRTSDDPTVKPTLGFLRIINPGSTLEGTSDGVGSWRSTNHVLHMAVRLRGNRQGDFFSAAVPAGSPLLTTSTTFFNQPPDARYQSGVYTSQWAEVCYYVQANGASASGTPLYSLYRAQRVVVTDNTAINGAGVAADPMYAQMSTRPGGGNLVFNNPGDLTDPAKRSIDPTNLGAGSAIDTLLLANVVSFTVRPLPRTTTPQIGLGGGAGDFMDIAYDSSVPNPGLSQIWAIEITIRVWDLKSQQTRQITIVQDL